MDSTRYSKACMQAWINCENLLLTLDQSNIAFSTHTVQIIDECANVCLGTMESLKQLSRHVYQAALLCFGICEECAEVCDRYDDDAFKTCASACRECSSTIAQLALAGV